MSNYRVIVLMLALLPLAARGQNVSLPGASINAITCNEANHAKVVTIDDPNSHEDCTTGSGTDFPPHGCECYWDGATGVWRLHSHGVIDNPLIINGDVGIGIGVAQTNLHIQENNTETVPTVEVEQLSTGDAALQFSIAGDAYATGIDNTNDSYKISYSSGAGTAVLGTNDRFVILPNGRIGMGTAVPGGVLGVESTDASPAITLRSTNAASTSNRPFLNFAAETTVQSRSAGQIEARFSDTTDATRTSDLKFKTYDSAIFSTRVSIVGPDIGIGLVLPKTNFHISENNTDTTPTVEIEQLSTGDAAQQYSIVGDAYATGIDNTDDSYKISYAAGAGTAVLGTNDRFVINSSGDVGIRTASPDGSLHVFTGSAGAVTADGVADDLVVENNVSAGISILTDDSFFSSVYFGSPSDAVGAFVDWRFDDLLMSVGTATASADLALMSGNASETMRLASDGDVGIGTTPQTNFHVQESNTDTVPMVELEQLSTGDAAQQFSIVGDAYAMGIDNSDDTFQIAYASGAGTAVLGTNARFVIDSGGDIGIGTADPAAPLHIFSNLAEVRLQASGASSSPHVSFFNGEPQNWDIGLFGPTDAFLIADGTGGGIPFTLEPGADDNAIYVDADGKVGINDNSPVGRLHVTLSSGQSVCIETASGTACNFGILATAPATCTAPGDTYTDTSGAYCQCWTTNTWTKVYDDGSASCV